MSRNWIAVACAAHVRRGIAGGFMQVCRGKAAPLRRIAAGDRVTYYSPTAEMGSKDRLQTFTAVGIVKDCDPYRIDTGGGFCPYRRDVFWIDARPAPIRLMIGTLDLCAGKKNWGFQFRFGLLPASEADMARIAEAMGVAFPVHTSERTSPGFLVPGRARG